jgi:hypothetical protein
VSRAGRPFSIGSGDARSAPLGSGGGWPALREMDLSGVSPELRRRLAELWANDALMEHASVASFSRFSLHLLAVAAPPELVEDAHRAALDEVRHARICFALASAYGGEPLGPGPLPLEGDLLGALDLPSVAVATVQEGCVGETLASLEAATAAELAQIVAPRAALTTIADDEGRHAELAWRFIRWCIDTGGEETADAVRQAFSRAIARMPPTNIPLDPMDQALAEHGRLSDRRKAAVLREGLADVVRPAAIALLGSL